MIELRSAEEMASEDFGPRWLTEAFHAALRLQLLDMLDRKLDVALASCF